MTQTTYLEALSAYWQAARERDFPAALAAVAASPPHPPREYAPDGTLEWDYNLGQEIEFDTKTSLGYPELGVADVPPIWTEEQARQLKEALKPKPWDYEAALDAYRRAAREQDFRAAMAAVWSAPVRVPADRKPDGTSNPVGYRSIGEHIGYWPDGEERRLLMAAYDLTQRNGARHTGFFYGDDLPPASDEDIDQAQWAAWDAQPKSAGFRDAPMFRRAGRNYKPPD